MDEITRNLIGDMSLESQQALSRLIVMNIGDVVSYNELNVLVMGDIQKEKRFCLNTARRHLLREKEMVFGCVKGEGMKRLNDSEKIIVASATRHHIQRQAHKSMKILATVEFDGLGNAEKIKHNAEMSAAGVLRHMAKPRQMKRIEASVTQAGQKLQLKETLKIFGENHKLEIVRPAEEKKA